MPVVRASMEQLVFMVGGWVNFHVSAVSKLLSYHISMINAMLVSDHELMSERENDFVGEDN